jgi:hypothetical protein
VGGAVVDAGAVVGPVAVVGADDGAVVARVVEVRLGSVAVVEALSSPLHAPAISRAISTQGATRRAREGLTPATIPAAVAPLTAVGGRALGSSSYPRRSRLSVAGAPHRWPDEALLHDGCDEAAVAREDRAAGEAASTRR